MIIDLTRFIASERPAWTELERVLDRIEADPYREMPLEEVKRFHFLYQKVSADLGRVSTFASEPELRGYLESLTARAYAEIHESRERGSRFRPVRWFANEFPRVFRKHLGAFSVSVAITIVGMIFGAFATALDEDAKEAIVPGQFGHLMSDPAKRVAEEEKAKHDRLSGHKATFASALMANNISVSIRALAFGMTWALGTIVLLFYNGVILGLVVIDYILAGQTIFLLGWLMPHGVIEIPAILIAGQGGLVLGQAIIGWGDRTPFAGRMRAIGGDLMTLIGGVAVMLVWAGIIESFLSQYHEPAIRYWQKILFGSVELAALVWFLGFKRAAASEEEET
jgi:uncharacterized membrane protein SpoIIM required for sporulation